MCNTISQVLLAIHRIIEPVIRFLLSVIIIVSVLAGEQKKNTSPYSFSKNIDLTIAGISSGLLIGSVLVDYSPMSKENISTLNPENISG